jgi:glycosyltransferase involved in cell wall biosynthesis
MNVMILCRRLEFGGAERQISALAAGLQRRGHRVAIVAFYDGGGFEEGLSALGLEIVSLGKQGRWDVIPWLGRFVRRLRRQRPDVIYGFLPVANLLTLVAYVALPGTPLVWGVRASGLDPAGYGAMSRLVHGLELRLARFANLVIANSQAGAKHAIAVGFPAAKMRVVPNGVDTARFRPDAAARARLREEWGLPPEYLLIGSVARLDPMKDLPLFVRAAAALAVERGDLRFVVIGQGPEEERARLRLMAEELGLANRIRFYPARLDVEAVYNALDLMVSSSAFGEGHSNVLAEAMACGKPVVATEVGDAAAILGQWGILVPPRDEGALADAIRAQLRRSPAECEAQSAGARRHVEDEFSVTTLVERTEALLLPLARRA